MNTSALPVDSTLPALLDTPELLAGEPANEPHPGVADGPTLLRALLADRSMRLTLGRWLRRAVPEQELDGLVQDVCVEALSMTQVPADPAELRPWLHGLARRVRADFLTHRRQQQHRFVSDDDRDDEDPTACTHDARDRLRWVERKVERGELPREVLGAMLQPETGEGPRPAGIRSTVSERTRVAYHRAKLRTEWEREGRDEEDDERAESEGRARPKTRRR